MTIVYTTIFGGSDSLKPAPKGADRCVCFVDDPSKYPDTKGWELIEFHPQNARRAAWAQRCLPHRLWTSYDRVVWVDASFTLIDLPRLLRDAGEAPIAALRHHERFDCYAEGRRLAQIGQSSATDIDRQLRDYRSVGFAPSHLSISCIIVRNRSASVDRFNETWDEQIQRYPGDNTQVSLDFSAWVHGLTIHGLSGTRHNNPYATHNHRDHKRRRRPYDSEVRV